MSEQQDDMLIAVIGSVGTGKSLFTNLLSSDASLESEASDVRVASFRDSESGRNVTIADCPGFGDPRVSDTDVLKKITDFLLKEYDNKRQLHGIIYLPQIYNTSFVGQSRLNLAMFRNLCGKKAYKNVVILTTFWDQLTSEQGEKQEELLKVTFKELLEGGAYFMRHDRTIESARDVLQHILTLDPTNVQIQEEIRIEGKTFQETAAGSVRREEVDWIFAEHNKEVAELRNELEVIQKRGDDALRQRLEEEQAKMQTEFKRREDEKAGLVKARDEAIEAQKRMETEHGRCQDQQREWESKFDNQERKAREMRETIANSEGNVTKLRDELESRINTLSQELEEERANFQTGLKQWEGERSELERGLAEANEAQKQMQVDRAKEKAENETWLRDQEYKWECRLGAQGKEHVKSIRALQSQVDQEKKARADADEEHERQRQEAATSEAAREEQERKKNEQWRRDQEYKWECRLGAQGKEHVTLIRALQSQLDLEKQAHADADKEYERKLQEAATNEAARRERDIKNNEQWRKDQECAWESRLNAQEIQHAKSMQALQSQLEQSKNARADADKEYEIQLDAQRKEHAELMEALQSQLDQAQQACADADKEYKRQLQEATTIDVARREHERKNNEQWRKDQEYEWESRLDAQRKEHAELMEALWSQLDQAQQARADANEEHERQLQEAATSDVARREHERKNNEQWRKDQEYEWESRLDAQRKEHAESVEALQSQLDQAKQARADANKEYERQLQEVVISDVARREHERENNEQWRKDRECEWESRLDAQGKEHAKWMEALLFQLGQGACADAGRGHEGKLQRRELERETNERWDKDQEHGWKFRFDAYAIWSQVVPEKRAQETIAKHTRDMTEVRDELEMAKKGNSALSLELEEERARLQRESARWEIERVELKKGLSEAEEDQERLKGAVREWADHEKRRQDQEREWQSRSNDQGERHVELKQPLQTQLDQDEKAREISKTVAKSENEESKNGNSALTYELEERIRLQRAQWRWVEERAGLKECLDEAMKAQMRVEGDVAKERVQHEKKHREKMGRVIAKHEEEMTRLGYEYDMMRRSNEVWRKAPTLLMSAETAPLDVLDNPEVLSPFLDTSSNTLPLPLLEDLLTRHIKPIFDANIHPSINPTTGRKLPRPAGGPLASQDFYDSQRWKEHPGIGNVILWCLKHFDRDHYEKIWHLLIPPIMTMLDDYEPKYKLSGVRIVREMMNTVPGSLLKRTGVDGLIRSALSNCLAHLHADESPHLIREAIRAQLELTLLTTRIGERVYFDQLCELLGEGIIRGVWFYGYEKEDVILASIEALPSLIRSLDMGCVRFFKALTAQFLDSLMPKPLHYVSIRLQVASLEGLLCIMDVCAPRIDVKKASEIANAVCRCWVTLPCEYGEKSKPAEVKAVREMIRQTCERLKELCPAIVEDYKLMLDGAGELSELFQGLV
ncbi:hypothetical protein APHAL10511_005642 [Amanita phalloides]|nr:hypothetical protein APHAL10511_005642 [Amanita phalloides]